MQDHILLLESDKVDDDDDDDVVLLKIVRNLSPIANRLLVFFIVSILPFGRFLILMVVDNAGDSLLKISNTPTTFFFLELT